MTKPEQLKEIDVQPLQKICQEYIDFIDSKEYHEDNDYRHFIFEAAIATFFGEEVWKFFNKKTS